MGYTVDDDPNIQPPPQSGCNRYDELSFITGDPKDQIQFSIVPVQHAGSPI